MAVRALVLNVRVFNVCMYVLSCKHASQIGLHIQLSHMAGTCPRWQEMLGEMPYGKPLEWHSEVSCGPQAACEVLEMLQSQINFV